MRTVDRSEIAFRVGPLVPDGDAVFAEVADIGVPFQEPEQLVDNRFEMDLLGGQERKSIAERNADLGTKNGDGSGSGAVLASDPFIHDTTE